MEALHNLALCQAHYKGVITGLQSSVILQQAYVERVHGQLEAKEKKSGREKGALKGGHARLMTEDEVFNEIELQKEAKAQQQLEKEKKRGMMEEYKIAMEEWKKSEEVRRAWNVTRCDDWEKEVQAWTKLPKPRGKQPLLGKLRKPEPKPTHPTNVAVDEDEVSVRFEETWCSTYLTTRDRVSPTTKVTVTHDTVNRTDVSRFQRGTGLNTLG